MQKTKPWRSTKYLLWVKSLPCAVCGNLQVEAHHLKGCGGFSGVGLRASDCLAVPLCRKCHNESHRAGSAEWQLIMVLKVLDRAFREGFFKV